MQTHFPAVRLQPLRIPAAWKVDNNKFYEVDPNPEIAENDDFWQLFETTLFYASCAHRFCGLDLGWSPMWSPTGKYLLTVISWQSAERPNIKMPKRKIKVRKDGLLLEYQLESLLLESEEMRKAWRNPAFEFETRSRAEVVAKMEDILWDVAAGGARYVPRNS